MRSNPNYYVLSGEINRGDTGSAGAYGYNIMEVAIQGVLRGMHFQTKNTQGKLVRVTEGEVYDVAIDLRKGSKTYGKWEGILLTAENKKQFYVPEGFAHGFLVVSEEAIFNYKCTFCVQRGR